MSLKVKGRGRSTPRYNEATYRHSLSPQILYKAVKCLEPKGTARDRECRREPSTPARATMFLPSVCVTFMEDPKRSMADTESGSWSTKKGLFAVALQQSERATTEGSRVIVYLSAHKANRWTFPTDKLTPVVASIS